MTPDFNIWAEGNLITDLIKQRLISLRITDEAGITSDSVEICLDDRDSLIEMPSSGSKLQVHLGYVETGLVSMGLYIVDEVALEGHPQVMKIKGHAADLKASFKSQKTDEWHQKTIGDLVSTIAAKHGYEPRIASQFANIVLPHIDQTAESDMHLLSRLAQLHGAISKPANGFLLFVPEGKAKSFTGQLIGGSTIDLKDVASWRFTFAERDRQASVICYWHDPNKAEPIEEKAGDGEPVHTLRGVYPNSGIAKAAAEAKLERLTRGTQTLNITLAGRADLVAESKIYLSGFRSGIPSDWIITRAEHTLDSSGYRTTIDASRDFEGDTDDQ
jgi:phage protein D